MIADCTLVHKSDLKVWRVTADIFPSNCYICDDAVSGKCWVIDPGLSPEKVDAALKALDLTPTAVLCTHGHFDHTGGAAFFQTRHGIPVYLHGAEQKILGSSNFLLMAFKIPARVKLPFTTALDEKPVSDRLEAFGITVHHTPGHTPGSCIFEIRDAVFTGDTIYAKGIGLSRLPGEDAMTLRASIRQVIDRFADDSLAMPGHGQAVTFKDIRYRNHALRDFLASDILAGLEQS